MYGISAPALTDKSARNYGTPDLGEFRYIISQTITVYSENVDTVRAVIREMANLGKDALRLIGGYQQASVEYMFSGLNDIKPMMVGEATAMAREVAMKFAEDSKSELGKIKRKA